MEENYLYDSLKDVAIDSFLKSKLGIKLNSAMESLQNKLNTLQTYVEAMADKNEDHSTTSLKVITVLTFAILGKIAQGEDIKSFSKDDWKEILSKTSQVAILMDKQSYTVFIFTLYENYINYSADCLDEVYPEKAKKIKLVADELSIEKQKFAEGIITEPMYVESCLWICLDAMIKLLASVSFLSLDGNDGELSMALFEFARLKYYQEEHKIIQQYIDSQYQMDEELQTKYESFLKDLQKQMLEYQTLIDNAFAPDFREAFLGSIALAKSTGVNQKEILTNISDIDDYFL